jgi:RNA polymerase sigma factor (sigma-70 family)
MSATSRRGCDIRSGVADAELDELLARVMRGDPAAEREVVDRYQQRIRAFAAKLGDGVDAESIAQIAMTAGLEGIRGGKRPDRFTKWLLGVARNVTKREFAKERPTARPGNLDFIPDRDRSGAGTRVAEAELRAILKRTLERLPGEYRDVLELRFVKGHTRERTAEMMGISTEALDKRMAKAFERLRGDLSRHFTTFVLPAFKSTPVTAAQVEALRPSFREAFTLRHRDALSPEQIAVKLGVAEKTVHERLKTAYELLRARAADDFGHLWK